MGIGALALVLFGIALVIYSCLNCSSCPAYKYHQRRNQGAVFSAGKSNVYINKNALHRPTHIVLLNQNILFSNSIYSSMMRWAWYIAQMGYMRNPYNILARKYKHKRVLGSNCSEMAD